jgi:hypothetical protein
MPFFAQFSHAIVELRLITSILLDLTWVAPDNDRVKLLHDLEELVMLLMNIVHELAAHSC